MSTKIDVVTALEYSSRIADALTAPSIEHPVCLLARDTTSGESTLYVYPQVTPIEVDYLRAPTTPFLDYYVNDTTGVVTYLEEGDTDIALPSGCTYRDGTAGPDTIATSLTVDFEFGDDDKNALLNIFASKLGLQLRDADVVQYANNEQLKERNV
ncbi:MAG: hypothetical protein WC961_07075 [Anaerovoracaceae bacterium]